MAGRPYRPLRLPAIAAAVAFAMTALACGIGASDDRRRGDPAAQRAPNAERQPAVARPATGAGLDVSMEAAADAGLDGSAQLELAVAARRFATTLVDWLYGERRTVDVAPITPAVRRELATAPPYVPDSQIGSGEGRATHVRVYLQTARSGVLVVAIRDARTDYPVAAGFELRAGDWRIVHLNSH
jgi:hypothetical protein